MDKPDKILVILKYKWRKEYFKIPLTYELLKSWCLKYNIIPTILIDTLFNLGKGLILYCQVDKDTYGRLINELEPPGFLERLTVNKCQEMLRLNH